MLLTPQIIAEITNGEYIGEKSARNIRVVGAVRDHRDIKPDNLFICVRGNNVDGHTFANKAYESGAACCLAEQEIPDAKGPYVLVKSTLLAVELLGANYRSHFNIPIIGVTGSVGKTSTKELIAVVLSAKFKVLKTQGNMNNPLGVALTLLSLNEEHEAAVIEMGIDDFGNMSRIAKMVRPNIFIITRIGYSHLKALGDLNGVLRAKSEAFSYMNEDGIAILNGDDELLFGYDPGMRKITFGLGKHNDFRAENIVTDGINAVLCDIVSNSGRFPVRIPAYGIHLAQLAAAAAAVGYLFGVPCDDIRRAFLSYVTVGSRAKATDTGFITLIDDCYNANPDSVEGALMSLAALPNRSVAILGDMLNLGVLSDELHRKTGVYAAQKGIDCLICCGSSAVFIYEGYTAAGGKAAHYYHKKAEIIDVLPELIVKGDAVLVKASRDLLFEEIVSFLNEI